jgi:MFS family permease
MSVAALRRAVRESVSGLPREFWWLWTSTLVNRLGAFVATFMALYLTLDRGYSASYAGLVAALHGLGGVVSSLGAGVMTDRLGRRPTLLVAQASTALSVALLGFMRDPVAIAAVAFLVGMASNASRPAVQAMMADIVRPEDRVRAFSLNNACKASKKSLRGRDVGPRVRLPHRVELEPCGRALPFSVDSDHHDSP